jgi:hypothetical protein
VLCTGGSSDTVYGLKIKSWKVHFALAATDEGQAVWIAWPRRSQGSVELACRWFTGTQEIPEISVEAHLLYDVFPRQLHRFWVFIEPPQEPGSYLPEVGLITMRVVSLSDLRMAPIRLHVTVGPLP